MAGESTPQSPITIQAPVGADVVDKHGERVGEFTRVVVDAREDLVTDLVVRHGTILHSERLVSLRDVVNSTEDTVTLGIDAAEFDQLPEYNSRYYRAPDVDYTGPPGWDAKARGNANLALDAMVAIGPLGGFGNYQPTGGFPGGEREHPDRQPRPFIGEGTAIIASDGEQVGEVSELLVDVNTGDIGRLFVKEGWLFPSEAELPVRWIEDLSDKGVILNVGKGAVEELLSE